MSLMRPQAEPRIRPRTTALARIVAALSMAERALITHRQRRALMSLSDETLKDIGLSRADAEREGAKWFWQ